MSEEIKQSEIIENLNGGVLKKEELTNGEIVYSIYIGDSENRLLWCCEGGQEAMLRIWEKYTEVKYE